MKVSGEQFRRLRTRFPTASVWLTPQAEGCEIGRARTDACVYLFSQVNLNAFRKSCLSNSLRNIHCQGWKNKLTQLDTVLTVNIYFLQDWWYYGGGDADIIAHRG